MNGKSPRNASRPSQNVDRVMSKISQFCATSCIHVPHDEVKDPDQGLIDFRTKRRGREVYLCWKLGEGDRVAFWHDLETGFSGRRPLAELA